MPQPNKVLLDLADLAQSWNEESVKIYDNIPKPFPKPFKPRCQDSFNDGVSSCLFVCAQRLNEIIKSNIWK